MLLFHRAHDLHRSLPNSLILDFGTDLFPVLQISVCIPQRSFLHGTSCKPYITHYDTILKLKGQKDQVVVVECWECECRFRDHGEPIHQPPVSAD